jgi:[ribosomal protein S5]-alanine N-acetyltransferase
MRESLPVLMGRRILLREPHEGDAEALFRHTSDPEVTRYLAFDPPAHLDETRGFIARCREHRLQDREYTFVIADVVTDEALGVITLRHLDPPMGTAQIGTWIARSVWGSGVNLEAKQLLLDYAFGPLGLHRIEARIVPGNRRSCRAFEKLGAQLEGTLRESFAKGARYDDTRLYAILGRDWLGRQATRGR